MSTPAISVEGISKCYRLGAIGRHTLVDEVQHLWCRLRGKDPNAVLGKVGGGSVPMQANKDFWALRDITFEVQPGEVLGVIGGNGAGKSTLLKILSRITEPTKGRAVIQGRVGSLLEVGTGFHPELTGRENVFMNGTILGMRKREVAAKFDEIVAFSGIEKFIDTPVKRYSSGMYVRLAFAVAAHLEPEILIVDEVLAVGDAEFQKRCLGKMGEVARHGRTVLFVSHNMAAVSNLCTKCLYLQDGEVRKLGDVDPTLQQYLSARNLGDAGVYEAGPEKISAGSPAILRAALLNPEGQECHILHGNQPFDLLVDIATGGLTEGLILSVVLKNRLDQRISTMEYGCADFGTPRAGCRYRIRLRFPADLLFSGAYQFMLALHIPNREVYELLPNVCGFTMEDDSDVSGKYQGLDLGVIKINPTVTAEDAPV